MKRKQEYKLFNIMQIRAFLRVAQTGSISQAAHNLFRTQSAITRSIRELEHILGESLFERHSAGMLLTEQGKSILPRAIQILDELQQVPPLIDDTGSDFSEPLWLYNVMRLKIFLALYQLHSTRNVANSLDITSSAVSAAIKTMEQGCGAVLFRRTAQGMMPTKMSRKIAPSISRALNEIRRIPEEIAAMKGIVTGTVHVGALPLSRAGLLPKAIINAINAHETIKVATDESAFDRLVSELRGGNIDLIIGALRHDSSVDDLDKIKLFTEELILLTRPAHFLTGRDLMAADFDNIKWVLPRENAPSRHSLIKAFRSLGMDAPQPVVETGDPTVVRELLLRSDMVAVVSSHQLEYEISIGVLTPLRIHLNETHRDIGIMSRKGALHSPATRAFIRSLKEIIPGGPSGTLESPFYL
ncbi:LysR family transcriptional regulator [Yersinia massiliensis]|uniref:LysR family transcriptional regulator n=1 Tax=Yersinia massiliensis TaxID=419257 RepID=UPI00066FE959|nr:LysR family transcriptional regulator [Yersinia massiliensis]